MAGAIPGRLTLALVLISLGVLVLLRNLGRLSEGGWQTAWKLWPLILVFIGLEILIAQGRRKGSSGKSRRE